MPQALIPFGLGLIFFVVVVSVGIKAGKRARVRVGRLAEELGLALEPPQITLGIFQGPPRASGVRRGKRIEIYNYSTGSGKSRTTWSAISAQPRADGGLTFKITSQGFGSKIATLFGAREIQVGDAEFDAAWFIETNRPEFLTAALLPEFRAKLQSTARGRRGVFKLEHGKVVYAEVGGFFDEARCQRFAAIADIVCDFADMAEVHASSGGR
jgi:hypothetical protein